MSRSRRNVVTGVVAVALGLVGMTATMGTAEAATGTPELSTLYKAIGCPRGTMVDPSDSQRCVPQNMPWTPPQTPQH